jgi:uncharacterized protein (TIGR02453 family)
MEQAAARAVNLPACRIAGIIPSALDLPFSQSVAGEPVVEFSRFEPSLFQFLEDLTDNNNRPWFQENKQRYEREVLEPCMGLIRAFEPRLKKISKYFVASDRRVGGSLMRVYRDTRFAKDSEPYKTNVGIQFRHEFGRDVHSPGFYVHISVDECFLGAGTWRPEREALTLIRQAIDDDRSRWRRARNDKRFRERFELEGDSLKKAPRDYPADHPLIEDLRRTDFIALREVGKGEVLSKNFLDKVAEDFAASCPFMRFLCRALNVPF